MKKLGNLTLYHFFWFFPMNIVLLQSSLSEDQIHLLTTEFPQYLFIAPKELEYKNLTDEIWGRIEIIYGNRLTAEDLKKASQLKWIHSPSPNVNPLCINEIEKRGNIIVTRTKEENTQQISEYVMAGVLSFSKNLFYWKTLNHDPSALWSSKQRNTLWTLQGRTFLQIGLGVVGSEIAHLASQLGMNVWGLQERHSFHPYCRKIFVRGELHALLSMADIVCLALPREWQKEQWLKKTEFELMKEDSILVIIGPKNIFNEEALAAIAHETKKFRGILLDLDYPEPLSLHSKLWGTPNVIITPEIAPRPKLTEKEAFRLFRHNLRQYLHGNFTDMLHIVS